MKPKVLAICGTRPDAIKIAPVVLELRKETDIDTRLAVSGQHKEMLAQALSYFALIPDVDFEVMQPKQTLAYLTATIMEALDGLLAREKPSIVVAQGDTTTTFVAALASFYHCVPFAHVEAGLRTPSVKRPFPEEFNRRATSQIASLHFAPTPWARDNLLKEGVPESTITVTGNTSIDAVLQVSRIASSPASTTNGRIILVTTHRRENWGEPQRSICGAIKRIVENFSDVSVVVSMHKNEVVRDVLLEGLSGRDRITLIEPPDYPEFVRWMKACYFIMTDSGGIQEEAPSLGKPVLVLREETERPEGVAAGAAILVGTDEGRIWDAAARLLNDPGAYTAMSKVTNPYGDGKAGQRICSAIRGFLGLPSGNISPFGIAQTA